MLKSNPRLAWAPIPLVLAAIAVLWGLEVPASHESRLIAMALNFVTATLVSLLVAFLVGRNFLIRGTPGLLLLGCGVLIWGPAGFLGFLFAGSDFNVGVTIHNSCMLLSAICHLSGAALSLGYKRPLNRASLWLGAAYVLAIGVVAIVVFSAVSGWLPVFFVQGLGGTRVRQLTLGTAVVLLLATSVLVGYGNRDRSRAPSFTFWYGLGLLLIAIGLFGVMLDVSLGSALNWTGRVGQALGGAYLLVAAIMSVGESTLLETALFEARTRYHSLIELAADGIAVHQPISEGGKLIEVNPALCSMLGYTAQELCELSLMDLLSAGRAATLAQKECRMPVQDVFRHEETLVGKDGRTIPAEIHTRLFEMQGRLMVLSVVRDIGERRRAEEAIRRSESMLAHAQRVANMGSWEWNIQSGELLWSDHVYKVFGLQPGVHQPTYESFLALIESADRPRVQSAIDDSLSGMPFSVEWRTTLADGSETWMLSQGEVDRDETGKPVRMIGTVMDVTERKRREELLRDMSQRLTYHVDHSPVAVIEFGPDMELLRWSGEAERIFGWKAEEVLGKRMTEFPWIYTEDLEAVKEVSVELRTGSNPQRFSANRNFRKDGSVVYCEWYNSSLLDASGQARSILSLVLDVTERTRVEQELRESDEKFTKVFRLNAAPIGLSRLADGLIIDVNEAWEEVFGYSRSEVVGRKHAESSFWKYDTRIELAKELKAHGSFSNKEIEFVRKNGETWTALTSSDVITLHGDSVVVSAFVDITERKRSEERMREAQKLESLGLLAGGVAHDFNNLLVGVIGNASLAQEMLPQGHPVAELISKVVKTGEQAAHLTRQMLAYSGKGRFVVEPVNLSKLIPEINGLVHPSISNKATLCFELNPNVPPVEADRGQMQQIYMNLVLNAAEAIGDEVGVITVRTATRKVPELGPGDYVSLEVIDTGCGMDEETKAKIFDPFFTTKFTGRGLGLAAVSGIIRAHKGSVTVTSTPGRGSRFEVLLPAAEQPHATLQDPAMTQATPVKSGTVLVVDDEEVVRTLAAKALERSGHTVLAANGGPAAIQLMKTRAADVSLVLLDLSMPGMGGQETLRELRKIRPAVRVLISSGYSEKETMRLFQGCDVLGFVQKPYTSQGLVEVVNRSL